MLNCGEAFQVLTYEKTGDYLWINFTPGDEVPASAVVRGYWRDWVPLYITNAKAMLWKPGYYNIATKQIYVKDAEKGKQRYVRLLLKTFEQIIYI